jgi:hypothetical protein
MKRVGIAGFHNFDAGIGNQIVEKRLVFMTPEWKEAFKYATMLADQKGLEMTIASSPGWSESGGPWVKPEEAMKKYVWSETRVEGGRIFTGTLPTLPESPGTYRNQGTAPRSGFAGGQQGPPDLYKDAAVIAYRAPDSDRSLTELQAKVTSSAGSFDVAALISGDLSKGTLLPPAPVGQRSWIQYEFPQPQTFRGLTFMTAGGGGGRGAFGGGRGGGNSNQQLEASDNGTQWRPVTPISPNATISFKAETARFFRVSILTPDPATQQAGRGGFEFSGPPPAGAQGGGQGQGGRGQAAAGPAGTQIAQFELHTAVVNRFQDKAGFSTANQAYGTMPTPSVPAADVVKKADVIDLTSKMRPDGTLDWTPPAGRWVVIRLGYSLIGEKNNPASPEGTGLEVDKLSPVHTRKYFETYLDMYKDASGGLMGPRGIQYVLTDSWESGAANWTENMFAEFSKRRGYDLKPWVPALAGHVVESAEATDRFLFDYRKTLSEMLVEYHYDMLTQIAKERGMKGRYSESHEGGRAMIADGMDVKRSAAIPMSAMWTNGPGRAQTRYDSDIIESASVAHIYGQNLVAAESMTASQGVGSSWAFSPETLKPTADRELSNGLNRFVIHCSVHQSTDDKIPGLSLGPFGQWFNRHETWAEYAKPWMTYLARSSYMLQQGKSAADIVYYYGEDTNITAAFGGNPRPVPSGYGFDFINTDAVLKLLSVSPTGTLTTPSGMSYRVLALDPNTRHMPLAVLRKIQTLVNAGAGVVGPKPIDSPSLTDDQAQVKAIADQLWGGTTGKGKVFGGGTLADALKALNVVPDFEYTKPAQDTELAVVHRILTDGDFYWISHRNTSTEDVEASFRITGKAPELWHADTGVVENASYRTENGRTIVPLHLISNDAVFVVFRKSAAMLSRTIAKPVEIRMAYVDGPWQVAFQPNRGAPESVTLPDLVSWHENTDPGVKYFSGTGTYWKTVEAPADWFQTGSKLILDLGDVKNIADVTVNGKELGTLVFPPFRVDVTSALKPGMNWLEIKVTNLWVNRLIGDQQPNVTQKITYTASSPYRADSPLLPSGLIGPVQVIRSAAK